MLTQCDNCNGAIVRLVTGTINGVVFPFCSPECRKEFADFSNRIGHLMVIPDAVGEEHASYPVGKCRYDRVAMPDRAPVVATAD